MATTAVLVALAVAPQAQAIGGCPDITLPPVAAFTFAPAAPETGQVVSFDGSSSTPGSLQMEIDLGVGLGIPLCSPAGSIPQPITQWRWDFGDGSPVVSEADPLIEHTYTTAGDFTAKLDVLAVGFPSSLTKTITVKAKPADPAPAPTTTTTTTATTTPPPPAQTTTAPPTIAATTTSSAKTLRANAFYCRGAGRKRIEGQKQTPYSRCVSALKKLRAQQVKTAKQACKGASKQHVKGLKRTPYAQCVVGANALLRDMKG